MHSQAIGEAFFRRQDSYIIAYRERGPFSFSHPLSLSLSLYLFSDILRFVVGLFVPRVCARARTACPEGIRFLEKKNEKKKEKEKGP